MLITEYSFWFIFFCIAVGIVYAAILYRKNKSLNDFSVAIIATMAVLRIVLISLLCFFLLTPLLKTIQRTVEKPVIIIAQDNSESILTTNDSMFFKNEYKKKMNSLIHTLEEKYDVKTYSFADKVKERNGFDSIDYNEKQTDISALIDELDTRYSNRNVGAIILASDGLYNKGANPLYASEKLKSPLYTVALGDTAVKKDLILMKVNHNRIANLGNKFPLEIIIKANGLKGKISTLTVTKGNSELFRQEISIGNNSFLISVPVYLDANEKGLQHYKVQCSPLPKEMSIVNNWTDIYIDVVEAKQKIVILSDAPHPDIGAIKQSLENNQNYETESYLLDEFTQSVKKYNLVILYQLPNTRNDVLKILNELKADNIPVWIISGASTIVKSDLSIVNTGQKTNDAEPLIEQNFPLFTLSDGLRKELKNFPSLSVPFGNYDIEGSSSALLYQHIGLEDTKIPLLVFNNNTEQKVAILHGEGIWRWRLFNYATNGNYSIFDELITKIVQYLATKMDKSFFRINSKSNFLENASIEIDAEVYNQSYELINEPEVNISITNKDKKFFMFSFNKTTNAYHLNAGTMQVGDYSYEAKVKVGDKMFSKKGVFSISPLQVELTNTIADHQLLYAIAKKHNAKMIYSIELEKLNEILLAREDIKSIIYSEKKLNDLINLKWIFFLLLGLLSLEWFLRKRNGSY